MSILSDNIRTYRNMRGLTQTQLAVLLNRSVGAVSNWEKGVNSPDVDTIADICKILDVTPNEIFGWEKSKELVNYIAQLEDAKLMIEEIKKNRAELNSALDAYSKKFGKLLNDKDFPV